MFAISETTTQSTDITGLHDGLSGSVNEEMIVGDNSTVVQKLSGNISADSTLVGEEYVGDGLALDVSSQSINNGLEGCAAGIELEDRMNRIVKFIDIHHTANSLEEMSATATIVGGSLAVKGVGSFREAVEIGIPQNIFVDVYLEKGSAVCGYCSNVFCECLLHLSEFHNVCLPF